MSHFILVCEREGRPAVEGLGDHLEACARLLWPPGTQPQATKLIREGTLSLAVAVPADGLPLHGTSLCLGRFLDSPGDWWRPGTTPPDGTYALCRCSPATVELVTDIAASRAVWYYHDEDLFLAASSQRPLVALLGDFDLDREAVTWMVASRSLGPRPSYDRRLLRAPLDGVVRLDRHSWSVGVTSRWSPYKADDLPDDEHAERLHDALVETCSYLAPEAERWPLLLSGGYDSRSLLVGMREAGVTPRCVTWGFEAALRDADSDASVAATLARSVAAPHQFFALDGEHDLAVASVEEFIVRSEGQVTDFTMYVDGFATWRTLADQGCVGVIRGEQLPLGVPGRIHLAPHRAAPLRRRSPRGLLARPSGEPSRPDRPVLALEPRAAARRGPAALPGPPAAHALHPRQSGAAQSDQGLIRGDRQSAQGATHRRRGHATPGAATAAPRAGAVLELHGPAVPFAKRPAATLPAILKWPEMRLVLAEGLSSDAARRLYYGAVLDEVAGADAPARSVGAEHRHAELRAMLPRKLKDRMLPVVGVRLDTTELALRMAVAARAVRLFEGDATCLGASPLAVGRSAARLH